MINKTYLVLGVLVIGLSLIVTSNILPFQYIPSYCNTTCEVLGDVKCADFDGFGQIQVRRCIVSGECPHSFWNTEAVCSLGCDGNACLVLPPVNTYNCYDTDTPLVGCKVYNSEPSKSTIKCFSSMDTCIMQWEAEPPVGGDEIEFPIIFIVLLIITIGMVLMIIWRVKGK